MKLRRSWTQLGAAFMLGAACAFWVFPIMMGGTIQKLRLNHDRAIAEAEALRAEILKMKQAQSQQDTHPTVRRVKVKLDGPSQRVQVEGERRFMKVLNDEVGRRIDDISSLLIMQKFQGKGSELEIDGVTYYLEVKVLVIGPELALYGVLTTGKESTDQPRGGGN